MGTSDLQSRLDFLTDAGHVLSRTAPVSSAYIMSQRNKLIELNNINPPTSHKLDCCGACGHVFTPNHGSHQEPKVKSIRKEVSSVQPRCRNSRATTGVTLTCGLCGKYTAISITDPPRPAKRHPQMIKEKKSNPVTSQDKLKEKVSANAGSRKRAKNRKAGLQNLLDRSKLQAALSGRNLGLEDFMKK